MKVSLLKDDTTLHTFDEACLFPPGTFFKANGCIWMSAIDTTIKGIGREQSCLVCLHTEPFILHDSRGYKDFTIIHATEMVLK